jgi:cobalt-zinc-cadmium efflux system outer membrane protein
MKQCCLLAALSIAAFAQTNLSVGDAVAKALSSHPLLAASSERIDASEGEKRQAGLSPNPRFILQSENFRSYGNPGFRYWNDTDNFAYLHHTFETSGKRDRRLEAASIAVRRAELERDLLRRQIASRVKQAYWDAAATQRIYELLLENGRNFQRIIEYHEIRVREGAMAEADLLRVRLEGERLAIAANNAFLEAERSRIHLFREMGQAEFPESVRFDSLEEPGESPVRADASFALEQRSEMSLARLAVEQAQANLRLEQANARPNLDFLFGYKRTEGFHTLMSGVQFDLPFRNRNQGRIASATAEIGIARSELASTAALVRAEVNAAAKEYEIRRRQISESLKPMLTHGVESSGIAQAAYREGGADLLRLLDAERVRIDTQLLYYRALAEYRQSIARVETAMGVEP